MNMMVNTSDLLNEADTEKNNKIAQKKALSKLLAAWESKSAQKAKTYGGLGFLAVSLAACNSSSDDTAEAPAPTTPTVTTPTVVTNAAQALTDSTTADVLVGDGGNDTFNATAGTYANTDQIVDSATDDADVLNLVEDQGATPNVRNVETLNVELQNIAAATLDVSSVIGAKVLNHSRGDLVIASQTITGDKSVDIDNLDASQIPTVNITGTVTNVDIDGAAADKAGAVINANTATGNVAYSGPGTINAAAATGTVQIDTVANTTEATKATVINAAKATTIFADTLLLGSIEINAAEATSLTIENASGGVTVVAAKAGTLAAGIDIRQIDASGATITTGSYASTAAGTIDLGGTAGTTDTATISGGGSINLDIGVATGAIDTVTLGANGANVTYTITSTTGVGTTFTKAAAAAGSQASTFTVTAAGNVAEFTGKTVTGIDVLDLTAGTAGAVDGALWTPGKVDVGFDNANGAITYSADQTYEITADQTTGLKLEAASTNVEQTVKIVAGDDNGTSTAVGTIEVNAMDLNNGENAKSGTVTLEAIVSNFTATSVTGGNKMSMVVTGDEDVTLGTVAFGTASSFNAATSTGKMNLTSTTLLPSVTTGSGADTLIVNGGDVHTVSMNGGDDTLTITDTSASSSFDMGAGADTVNVDKDTNVYVVAGGAGNDTFTTQVALKATIAGGEGSADEITIDAVGALTLDAAFRMSGIEVFDVTAANGKVAMGDESFASDNTLVLQGDAAADIFAVVADDTTGATIDASNITVGSGQTVTINYEGGTKDDVITGGVAAETFIYSGGSDTIEGGSTGTDTYEVTSSTHAAGAFGVATGSDTSVGTIINMGSTAVSSGSIYAGITAYAASGVDVAGGKQMHLYAASKTTNDADTVSLGGIETFTLGDGTDYFQGGSGDETVNGNAGKDYISMGDGNDTVIVDSTAEHATGEQIHGGLGNDIIQLTATTTLSSTDAEISGVEEITMGGTADITLVASGQTENFTVNDNTGISTITLGAGNHTIKLSASDTKDDIIILHYADEDTVTGFEPTANKDIIQFDISELEAAGRVLTGTDQINFVDVHDNNDVTAGAIGIQTLTAGATAGDAKNFFLIDNGTTKYANAAAAVDALENGGDVALKHKGNIAAKDAFLFAYENSDATAGVTIAVASYVAADDNSAGGGTAATTAVGNLTATDLITLQGVTDVTQLASSNGAFIA